MTVQQVIAIIRDLIEHGSGRARVLRLDVEPGQRDSVATSLRQELGAGARIVQVRDDGCDTLRTLNRSRDRLLREHTAIVFLHSSGDEARLLRRYANDLTAVVDRVLEVRAREGGDRVTTRERLAGAMRDRHQQLDLTGLIPSAGELVHLPLRDVFMRSAGITGVEPDGRPRLLLAPPGKGKTTALRFLAGQVASGVADVLPGIQLALFVPLATYAIASRDRVVPLLRHIEDYAAGLISEQSVDLGEFLANQALLLDGLDELPTVGLRRRVMDDAAQLARRAGGPLVIVSARDYVVDDLRESDLDGWDRVEIGDPDDADIARFVRVVLEARRGEGHETTGLVHRLVGRLGTDSDIRPFARTPLLLTFLVVLADLGRDLPDQRTLLYRELVEMLISSWRRLRTPSGSARPLRRADVLRVLAPLGWWLVRRGAGAVSERELLDELTRVERQREPDEEAARRAARERLRQIKDDTALLRTDGSWRFTHPTIAEFLAANAVLQDQACLDALCSDPYWPGWSQVVPFALALATDIEVRDTIASRIVDALVDRSVRRGRYDARFPTLLGNVLGEVRSLPASANQRLARRVLTITCDRRLAPVASFTAQFAVVRLLELRRERLGVDRELAAWFLPPRRSIRWPWLAGARVWWKAGRSSRRSVNLWETPEWAPLTALPGALERDEAVRLLVTWLEHDDLQVRCLAWLPWLARLDEPWRQALLPRLEWVDLEVARYSRRISWEHPMATLLGVRSEEAWWEAVARVYGAEAVDALKRPPG